MVEKLTYEELEAKVKQLEEKVLSRDRELEETSLELALGLSEVFEALKEIAAGNPAVRVPETSRLELVAKLKHVVNVTAKNLAETIHLSHEFAIGLAEHFDALDRVSKGDLEARVYGTSEVELLEAFREVTNHMIQSVSREITERRKAEEALGQRTQDLGARVKELDCLYGISHLVEKPGISLHEILEETLRLIPPSLQHPEITCARIDLEGRVFETGNWRETPWKQACDIFVHGEPAGSLEVGYLEEKPDSDEGPFLREERNLINAIAKRLGEITEHKRMEAALQEAHEKLEKRVKQRTSELAMANERLKLEIEERRRAEEGLRESEAKHSTLVENSLTGIYIDQGDGIVFANRTFAEIYGYPKDELLGIDNWKLAHPGDRAFTDEMRARRLKGEEAPAEYEARGLRKDGETIWIRRRNTCIDYGGKPAILGNIVDITEQKQAEEELRVTHEELENFVRVVSHDLKTPIIAIQGFSARLQRRCGDALGEKGGEYLGRIDRSARRMEMLVSDLLELSRMGRVVSSFKDVSSVEMVGDITSGLQTRLKDKGIRLCVSDNLPIVYCDGERLYQVFENLLVNAVKFVGDATEPKIEIGYEDRGDMHQFHVRDNGIGIDPKYHRRVFEAFERLRQIEDDEGTGLGLAIVEKIVESHGGTAWVKSQKEEGATFYFTLPKVPSCRYPNTS
jgi:PAS domain S-box-containing protein